MYVEEFIPVRWVWGFGRRLSAVTVGASSSDKAAKKPNNAQLK